MAQSQKNKGVRTQHPSYVEMLGQWEKCRDVFAGTEELREHTTKYLPRLTDEPETAYMARIGRGVLYNALFRTVSGFIGMLFRISPVLNAPPNTESMTDDVTLTGIPLTVFAQGLAEECLVVGRAGVLVNYPVTSDSMTIADAQALNVRPYMSVIKAEQMINWRQRRVNNKYQLSMVTIQEEHSVPIDEFEDKEVTRYRVLDLDENDVYRVRIFEVQEKNRQSTDVELERFYPTMNGAMMNYIPLYIIGPDDITPDIDTPMLIDLADLCVSHYQAYNDLATGNHWSALPVLYITGHELQQGESVHIGGGKALIFPNPAAKVGIAEVGTGGFSSLENQLNRLEQQMVSIGSRMLEGQKFQAESAETAGIYRSGENSVLSAISISLSTCLTVALKVFAEWAGDSPEDVRFTLNKEFFREPVTSDMITALVSSMQGGMVSREAIFSYLKKSEFYDPHITFESEQGSLEEDKTKIPKQQPAVTKIQRMPDGSMQATKVA